jgi:hypothetical protein
MRHAITVFITLAGLALPAQAQEGIELAKRAKSFASSIAVANAPPAVKPSVWTADANFLISPIEAPVGVPADPRRPSADCDNSTSDLCFDVRERHAVYRGVREYMPKMDGFRPESVSLKREGIVLKYSFK